MVDYWNTAVGALQDTTTLTYMGYGAMGAYLGQIAVSWSTGGNTPPLTGRPQIESAVIGGLSNLAAMVFMRVDITSMPKGMAIGFLGNAIWWKTLRGSAQNWGLVA